MNSLQNVFLLFVASIFLVAVGVNRHSNLESFVAEPVNNSPGTISVKWTVTDPSLVTDFRLQKKRNGNSSSVQNLQGCIQQTGSNSFECIDSDNYKYQSDEITDTQSVTYILYGISGNGSPVLYGEAVTEYTTNAVRRTWGSIKSMFQ